MAVEGVARDPGRPGTLFGVGLGPGDPELITVKAARLLGRLDVIFVPRRIGGRSFARSIAEPYLDPGRQEIVELDHLMGGPVGAAEARWDANAEKVAGFLLTGRDAAFLTEGDPLFYSTFLHTWSALQRICPAARVEVVPGVSSIFGAAAAAGLPLAVGSDRVAILPALGALEDLEATLDRFETVVLLKVASVIDRVLPVLEARGLAGGAGPSGSAVFVERAGRPEQVVLRDLRQVAGRDNDYFSLLIVRKGTGRP